MNIGEKIKSARLAKGYTQEELGEVLGVQKSAIAKYESGRVVNIKRSTLKKISDVLGIRPSELILDEEKNSPSADELSPAKKQLIDRVMRMSPDQLEKLDLLLRIVEAE